MRDGHTETTRESGRLDHEDANGNESRRPSNARAIAKIRDLWIRRGLPRSAAATLAQTGIWTVGDLRQLRLADLSLMPALTAAGMAAVLRLLAKSRQRAQSRVAARAPSQRSPRGMLDEAGGPAT